MNSKWMGEIHKRMEGIVATWLMKKGVDDSNVKRGDSCVHDWMVAFAKKMRCKRKPSALDTRQRQAPVLCACKTRTRGWGRRAPLNNKKILALYNE